MTTPKHHIELAGTATVGERGQIIVPISVRKKMNLVPGDKLIALYIADNDSVGFIKESKIQNVLDQFGQTQAEL